MSVHWENAPVDYDTADYIVGVGGGNETPVAADYMMGGGLYAAFLPTLHFSALNVERQSLVPSSALLQDVPPAFVPALPSTSTSPLQKAADNLHHNFAPELAEASQLQQ